MVMTIEDTTSGADETPGGSVVNLHRKETSNVGDRMSAPLLYFPELRQSKVLEVTGWKREEEEARDRWRQIVESAPMIVYGGGGLLEFEKYRDSLEYVAACKQANPRQKLIIWGAGHNVSSLTSWAHMKTRYRYDYSAFDLIGVRDYGHPFRWVPCASCMSPVFDKAPEPVQDFVFFFNKGSKDFARHVPKDAPADDTMANTNTTIQDVIQFLAKGETIVTSSYHGVYWGLLLGRKVVGIPTSSKFYDLKHPVPLCQAEDWQRYLKLARAYPEALEECRDANRAFARDVLALL